MSIKWDACQRILLKSWRNQVMPKLLLGDFFLANAPHSFFLVKIFKDVLGSFLSSCQWPISQFVVGKSTLDRPWIAICNINILVYWNTLLLFCSRMTTSSVSLHYIKKLTSGLINIILLSFQILIFFPKFFSISWNVLFSLVALSKPAIVLSSFFVEFSIALIGWIKNDRIICIPVNSSLLIFGKLLDM